MKHAILCFCANEPILTQLMLYDWEASVYRKVSEYTPVDIQAPLGMYITQSHFVDANFFHDVISYQSVSGIHVLNHSPIFYQFSKSRLEHLLNK